MVFTDQRASAKVNIHRNGTVILLCFVCKKPLRFCQATPRLLDTFVGFARSKLFDLNIVVIMKSHGQTEVLETISNHLKLMQYLKQSRSSFSTFAFVTPYFCQPHLPRATLPKSRYLIAVIFLLQCYAAPAKSTYMQVK